VAHRAGRGSVAPALNKVAHLDPPPDPCGPPQALLVTLKDSECSLRCDLTEKSCDPPVYARDVKSGLLTREAQSNCSYRTNSRKLFSKPESPDLSESVGAGDTHPAGARLKGLPCGVPPIHHESGQFDLKSQAGILCVQQCLSPSGCSGSESPASSSQTQITGTSSLYLKVQFLDPPPLRFSNLTWQFLVLPPLRFPRACVTSHNAANRQHRASDCQEAGGRPSALKQNETYHLGMACPSHGHVRLSDQR
jgi:hypothetical protein